MKNRIKQTRLLANLTQRAFASRLGISGPSVARLESGENNPSEQTIRAICSEFSVRREWLVNGQLPMQLPDDEGDEIVDAVLAGDNEFIKALIRSIAKTPDCWDSLRQLVNTMHKEMNKDIF